MRCGCRQADPLVSLHYPHQVVVPFPFAKQRHLSFYRTGHGDSPGRVVDPHAIDVDATAFDRSAGIPPGARAMPSKTFSVVRVGEKKISLTTLMSSQCYFQRCFPLYLPGTEGV